MNKRWQASHRRLNSTRSRAWHKWTKQGSLKILMRFLWAHALVFWYKVTILDCPIGGLFEARSGDKDKDALAIKEGMKLVIG